MTKESYNFGVDTEAKQLYTETSGMTAKRFTLFGEWHKDLIIDEIRDNKIGDILTVGEIVELLNALNDENEQLKSSDTITDLETQIMKLKKENEQLKAHNQYLLELLEHTGAIVEIKGE